MAVDIVGIIKTLALWAILATIALVLAASILLALASPAQARTRTFRINHLICYETPQVPVGVFIRCRRDRA